MKYLVNIVEELRHRVAEGLKITKEDASSKPVVLLEEVPSSQVEILEEPFIKVLETRPQRPQHDLFALDSSSRVIETPYVFIAIGAGSVFSRFTGRGIDVPDTASILGLGNPLCNHVVVVPEVEFDEKSLDKLRRLPGLIVENPLGVPYTSDYNKHLILVELRLAIEQCLLEQFHDSNLSERGSVLLVDGPLLYPHVESEAANSAYSESIRAVNRRRVNALRKLAEKGVMVVGIVKRLSRSYYLSSLDPGGIAVGKVNDEAYITALIMSRYHPLDKPLLIGPLRIRHSAENVGRIFWYIVVPRRIYPLLSGMGNYVVYRVEVLGEKPPTRAQLTTSSTTVYTLGRLCP